MARIAVPPPRPSHPILPVRGPVASAPARHRLPEESLTGARLPRLRLADQGLRVEQRESGGRARAVGGAGMQIAWHAGHGRSAR